MTSQWTLVVFCTCLVQASLCLLSVQEQHLVRCVVNVSLTYFVPGRSVVQSMPLVENTELKTKLANQLHQANKWPIIMEHSQYDEAVVKWQLIHPEGSFLIFVNLTCADDDPKCYRAVGEQFKTLHDRSDLNIVPTWGKNAHFVVVLTAREGTESFHLDGLFDYFFKFKIMRTIIILKKPRYFNVYANFPYQEAGRCHDVLNVKLLDIWVMEGGGYFIKDSNLFPKTSCKNLHGCPLRTIVTERFPSVFPEFVNGQTRVWGPEIELFLVIVTKMNATAIINKYFASNEKELYRETSGDLFENKADVIFGGRSNSDGETTAEYYWVTVGWYVPCQIRSSRIGRMFSILSPGLWIVTTLTLVLAAIVMVFLAKKTPGTSEWPLYQTVGSSLTAVLTVILGVSVSVMPRTPALRVFFLFLVWFCLAYNTVFLSYLTTYMIDPGYEPGIEDMDQLLASDLKFCVHSVDSHLLYLLQLEYSAVMENRVVLIPDHQGFTWAGRYKNCSLLMQSDWADFMQHRASLTDEERLCPLQGGALFSRGNSMELLPRNPVFYEVNVIVTRLVEAGIVDHLYDVTWNRIKISFELFPKPRDQSDYYSYSLPVLSPPFILLLIGYGLGALGLVLELLWHRYYQNINTIVNRLTGLYGYNSYIQYFQ